MSLREVLLDELKDLYSAENQLVKALPKTAKTVESDVLKQIFLTHLDETKNQVERLKQIFGILGKKPTGKHCSGMEGAIDEVKEALTEDSEGAVFDSGVLGGALRVEHYEIAGYNSAIAIAKTLGETEIAGLLTQSLSEELNAAKLVTGAGKTILKQALAEEGDDRQEPEKKPKNAKDKLSEQQSKEDEKDAEESASESPEDADDMKDKSAQQEEDAEDAEKSAKKATAQKTDAKSAAKKSSSKKK